MTQRYSTEDKEWDALLLAASDTPHYMQSSAWGESKSLSDWPLSRMIVETNTGKIPIQVFSRTVPGLGRMHYSPEVSGITQQNIPELTKQIRNQFRRGLAYKLELYRPTSEDLLKAFLKNGWVKANSVQHRTTVLVDLSGTEDEVFARIKKRARYEIRVAQKNGVAVKRVKPNEENFKKLDELMSITAKRTGAYFRSSVYTNKYWQAFTTRDKGALYFAYFKNKVVAAAYVLAIGKTAWYKDGGSVRLDSDVFAPRVIQWEIMKEFREQGIKTYDLSGIPAPEDVETSSLKGLFTFKTGFSTNITHMMPAVELPLNNRYKFWPKAEHQFLRLYSGLKKDFWY